MIQIVYVSEVELTGIEISFYAGSEEEKWAALTLRIKWSRIHEREDRVGT